MVLLSILLSVYIRHNSYTYSARIHTKTSCRIYLYLILIEFEVLTVINGPSTLLRFMALVRSAREGGGGGVINLGPFFTVRTSNTTNQRWCPSPPPPSVRPSPLALLRDNGFFYKCRFRPPICLAICLWLYQLFLTYYVFRDRDFPNITITVDNRQVDTK